MALATVPNVTVDCTTCGVESEIPKGVDPTSVRCPNVDAMWHAAYTETITRAMHAQRVVVASANLLKAQSEALTKDADAYNQIVEGVRGEAKKLAEALG